MIGRPSWSTLTRKSDVCALASTGTHVRNLEAKRLDVEVVGGGKMVVEGLHDWTLAASRM